jgi:hypothetical protein
MTKEEIKDWVYENFEVVLDEHTYEVYGRVDVDFVPKSDIGHLLDSEFANNFNMYLRGPHGEPYCAPIFEFLMKFYNVDEVSLKEALGSIYYNKMGHDLFDTY